MRENICSWKNEIERAVIIFDYKNINEYNLKLSFKKKHTKQFINRKSE